MTKKTEIDQLKLLAKRFAHATRSNHRDALHQVQRIIAPCANLLWYFLWYFFL